jgi:hypothetical protein
VRVVCSVSVDRVCIIYVNARSVSSFYALSHVYFFLMNDVPIRAVGVLIILFCCDIIILSGQRVFVSKNTMRYRKRRSSFLSSVYACTDIAFRSTVVVFSAVAHFRSRRRHHGARLCLYVIIL